MFPGQGSQKVGMGQAVQDSHAAAAEVFRAADAQLGIDLSGLCFRGPEAELRLTANTQPALLTTSTALWRALDIQPDAVAGHSLGEYSALVAAGALEFSTALGLVRRRGELMQAAVAAGEGAMAAVLGLTAEQVVALCAQAEGVVSAANFNSQTQVVIAGEQAAVQGLAPRLKADGAKVIPLPVSAPFHCALMQPAEAALEPFLADSPFQRAAVPVYVNVEACAEQAPDALRSALVRQVSRPVRWQESIERDKRGNPVRIRT
ncbi:MAG: ACP S-malonyltransferase, partial [Polyangiales bacterium]